MSAQRYCAISGVLFFLVAIVHLLRIVSNATVIVNGYDVPVYLSWFGVVVAAVLSVWAFRLASRGAS